MRDIVIRGARTHNLKNIDLIIPGKSLTVITGVSGSGKSSLAFDTLYAEGQRRYVESLSAYARQFLERMDKPDVDTIQGISPALAIQQRTFSRNPRSTVATITELYDYYRLLFGRIGKTYCCECGELVRKDTVSGIVRHVLNYPQGTEIQIIFRIPSSEENLLFLTESGFTRIFMDGSVTEINPDNIRRLLAMKEIEVLADRLNIRENDKERLADSIQTAFHYGKGRISIRRQNGQEESFSSIFECNRCHKIYAEPEPRLFSFNHPMGACPACQGFGNKIEIDIDLVIPDRTRTLREGAIKPWTTEGYADFQERLERFAPKYHIPLDVPVKDLPEEAWKLVLHGTKDFDGIYEYFRWLESKTYKMHIRILLSKYRGYVTCSECQGTRLRRDALCVKIGGKSIADVHRMTLTEAREYFHTLVLEGNEYEIARRVLEEIRKRLDYLNHIGLNYLTGDRLAGTLSGGEAQRISLATALGSSLVGTLYILDEPSIGLHPRDTEKLIRILHNLRNIGNTVVVVEHDRDMMHASDRIIDLGPGAGVYGGTITAQGKYEEVMQNLQSLTGQYLSGKKRIPYPEERRTFCEWITIEGAEEHNLKHIHVKIPLDVMTCITGVSGSGKSTLVHDILYAGLMKEKGLWSGKTGKYKSIHGGEKIAALEMIDQQPIGRSSRSNPVSYIKVYDLIREVMASQPMAKTRGYKAGTFSFNIPGGRCETCEGSGEISLDMQFLADVTLICEDCKGKRFKPEVLDIRYRGKNIHDILTMTVEEGIEFFHGHKKIVQKLQLLQQVGLGYLQMGQSSNTLSGGEAQRVKLASHLGESADRRTLYIMDEPTTGLHFDDIARLIDVFNRLLDQGHTLVVIEHHPDVILCSDYVIDLGPEGGDRGGTIVAEGTPEEIMRHPTSYTGYFLKQHILHLDRAT